MSKKPFFSILFFPLQLIKCCFEIIITPKYLLPLVVPYLIGIVTFFTSLTFGMTHLSNITKVLFSQDSWWFSIFNWGLTFPILCIISGLLSILAVVILAETFIEFFLEKACSHYNLPIPDIQLKDFAFYFIRSLKNDLKRLIMIAILSIITLICGFFPILLFIPPIILAFLSGFNLINLPFSMLDIAFAERKKIAKTHFLEITGLGATLLIFLIIPLGGTLFLPPAYLLALKKMANWQEIKVLTINQTSHNE